jgi:hypothetical protein
VESASVHRSYGQFFLHTSLEKTYWAIVCECHHLSIWIISDLYKVNVRFVIWIKILELSGCSFYLRPLSMLISSTLDRLQFSTQVNPDESLHDQLTEMIFHWSWLTGAEILTHYIFKFLFFHYKVCPIKCCESKFLQMLRSKKHPSTTVMTLYSKRISCLVCILPMRVESARTSRNSTWAVASWLLFPDIFLNSAVELSRLLASFCKTFTILLENLDL